MKAVAHEIPNETASHRILERSDIPYRNSIQCRKATRDEAPAFGWRKPHIHGSPTSTSRKNNATGFGSLWDKASRCADEKPQWTVANHRETPLSPPSRKEHVHRVSVRVRQQFEWERG